MYAYLCIYFKNKAWDETRHIIKWDFPSLLKLKGLKYTLHSSTNFDKSNIGSFESLTSLQKKLCITWGCSLRWVAHWCSEWRIFSRVNTQISPSNLQLYISIVHGENSFVLLNYSLGMRKPWWILLCLFGQ